jgi:hypothetical protein
MGLDFTQWQQSQGQQKQYAGQMGLLGDAMRDPNSSQNQFNLRNMSAQFNSSQPNYFDIAASQGLGGSIAGMQATAGKRQAGLLTNANFGTMMNDNQKIAQGYYGMQGNTLGQVAQGDHEQQGLLQQQDQLDEQQRQYKDSHSFWNSLLTTGLGVAGSVGGGLLSDWLNPKTATNNGGNSFSGGGNGFNNYT